MKTLQERDFVAAAFTLMCEVASVKAVCAVEAPRGGFNPDGSVVTLFEGHKFYKYTQGKWAENYPTLCFPKWTRQHYGKTWQAERARLERAIALDKTAALMSASWGKFQIMGFNFALAGYRTVEEFVAAMQESEAKQLDAFVQYVIHTGLQDELQRRDWAGFARGYNGADFKANQYDVKLAKAFTTASEAAASETA